MSSSTKKEYSTGKSVTSKGDKELLIRNEKVTSAGSSTTRHLCSKTVTKTVTGADGRREVTKEVITSDDGSECDDAVELDLSRSFSGRLEDLSQKFPEYTGFFDTAMGSFPSNRKELTHATGSDSGIFTDLEDARSHVPEFSSSSKTSTVRKQHVTKSYKMADEAGTEAGHESLGEPRTTTKRGSAKFRTSRGIHTSPLEKSSPIS